MLFSYKILYILVHKFRNYSEVASPLASLGCKHRGICSGPCFTHLVYRFNTFFIKLGSRPTMARAVRNEGPHHYPQHKLTVAVLAIQENTNGEFNGKR